MRHRKSSWKWQNSLYTPPQLINSKWRVTDFMNDSSEDRVDPRAIHFITTKCLVRENELSSCKRRARWLRGSLIAICTWVSWRTSAGRKRCTKHSKPDWWWSWDNKARRKSPIALEVYTLCTTWWAWAAPGCCTASMWWWRRAGWRRGSWRPSTLAASPATSSSC